MNISTNYKYVIQILLHITVWVFVVYILNLEFLDIEWGPYNHEDGTLFWPSIYGMVTNAFFYYMNYYLLIPRYLKKKEKGLFWIWTLFLFLSLVCIEISFDYLFFKTTGLIDGFIGGVGIDDLIIYLVSMLIVNIFYWALAFLFRWPSDFIQSERQKNQLTKDKLSAELEFLKAQINPHFLFNGINSIYHLISENSKSAQSLLLEFSNLLRYQLYECSVDFISLNKEIDYIKNYISIEEIRKTEDAIIVKQFTGETENYLNFKIAPLLISPFIENAFKYLSLYSDKEKNRIVIKLNIEMGLLDFSVKNTVDIDRQKKKNDSGIGLENVKQRLELIYNERYELNISEENNCFVVNLKLNL